jgi:hypothetical protein
VAPSSQPPPPAVTSALVSVPPLPLSYNIRSLSTGKMSVSHSERSDDAEGQCANKTNDEYGGIRASAVKLAKVLLLLVLSMVVMKSTLIKEL